MQRTVFVNFENGRNLKKWRTSAGMLSGNLSVVITEKKARFLAMIKTEGDYRISVQ